MRGLVRKHQDHDAGRYADGRGPARPKTADVRHSRRITRRQTHPRNFSPAKGTPAENLTGPGASRCSARLRTDKKRTLSDKYGYGRETFRQLRKSRQFPENRKESEGLFPIRFQAGTKRKTILRQFGKGATTGRTCRPKRKPYPATADGFFLPNLRLIQRGKIMAPMAR